MYDYWNNPDDEALPAGRITLTIDGKTFLAFDLDDQENTEIVHSEFSDDITEDLIDHVVSECYWEGGQTTCYISDDNCMTFDVEYLDGERERILTDEQRKNVQDVYCECERLFSERRKAFLGQDHIKVWEEMFSWIEDDGDFSFDGSEAGDWTIYNCGEKDCPIGWHKIASACNFYRENGVRRIEFHTVDEDGDWDLSAEWDDDSIRGGYGKDFLHDVFAHNCGDGYFRGNCLYYLHVAESGEDPCEIYFRGAPTFEKALQDAEAELKYLRPQN